MSVQSDLRPFQQLFLDMLDDPELAVLTTMPNLRQKLVETIKSLCQSPPPPEGNHDALLVNDALVAEAKPVVAKLLSGAGDFSATFREQWLQLPDTPSRWLLVLSLVPEKPPARLHS